MTEKALMHEENDALCIRAKDSIVKWNTTVVIVATMVTTELKD